MTTQISISGYLVGDLWWPIGVEAWKDASLDVTRDRHRFAGDYREITLRDVVDSFVCREGGDFSSAALLANAELTATRTINRDGRRITVSRSWPLSANFSVAASCRSSWIKPIRLPS